MQVTQSKPQTRQNRSKPVREPITYSPASPLLRYRDPRRPRQTGKTWKKKYVHIHTSRQTAKKNKISELNIYENNM